MRSIFLILIICSVVSCNKNKAVAKEIEGEYLMVKVIKEDGSEQTKNVHFNFDKASTDGKTFTKWNSFDAQDSTEKSGTYCIQGKGLYMVLITETQYGPVTDSAKVEDIDKKSMVIRFSSGISFFQKVDK